MFFIVLKCVFSAVTPSTARVAWIRLAPCRAAQ